MKTYNVKLFVPKYFAGKNMIIEVVADDEEDAKARTLVSMQDWIVEVKKK